MVLIGCSDDPWNQTAADNAEWLQRFKRDVGMIESGPGLAAEVVQWKVADGGTGFAPPYVCLSPQATIEPLKENPKIFCRDNSKPFEPDVATANRFLQSLNQRYAAPAKVFCSRELEKGLGEYVKREVNKTGLIPCDDELRDRARQIMSMQKTAADDPILLGKFKASMQQSVLSGQGAPMSGITTTTIPAAFTTKTLATSTECAPTDLLSVLPAGADMNISDEQVNDILEDLDVTF
jgi:hypothetical protein